MYIFMVITFNMLIATLLSIENMSVVRREKYTRAQEMFATALSKIQSKNNYRISSSS